LLPEKHKKKRNKKYEMMPRKKIARYNKEKKE